MNSGVGQTAHNVLYHIMKSALATCTTLYANPTDSHLMKSIYCSVEPINKLIF